MSRKKDACDCRDSGLQSKLVLGISACLLGEPVRYDGSNKRACEVLEAFGGLVEWVPVCPEVECGMSVPREPMHLEEVVGEIRLIGLRTRTDHTEKMLRWARKRLDALERKDLCGFVFKSKSPSCGLRDVEVHRRGDVRRKGMGLFARELVNRFPLIGVEDEARLHKAGWLQSFVERVLSLCRYRELVKRGRPIGEGLSLFHEEHEVLLVAHSVKMASEMGALVSRAAEEKQPELMARYEALLLKALSRPAGRAGNSAALSHMMRVLEPCLSPAERCRLQSLRRDYRAGRIPLGKPVAAIMDCARRYGQSFLLRQAYLSAHPLLEGVRRK